MKWLEIFTQSLAVFLIKGWTSIEALGPLAYLHGENHAGRLATGAAIAARQKFKDVQDARRRGNLVNLGVISPRRSQVALISCFNHSRIS